MSSIGKIGRATFGQVDANNDGKITPAEWTEFASPPRTRSPPRTSSPQMPRSTPLTVGGTTPSLAVWYDSSSQGKTAKQELYEKLRKDIFTRMDADGSYTCTRAEFVSSLTAPTISTSPSIWKTMSVAEANRIFDDITSGFGSVTIAKLDGYLVQQGKQVAIKKYREAKGADRYVDAKEFVEFLVGEGASRSKAKEEWRNCDYNSNGKVTLTEFRDWAGGLLKVSVLADKFT